MKVAILTTSPYGTTGHHLPVLFQCKSIEIVMVIVSGSVTPNKRKKYIRIAKKILKIGIGGALNGVRMRKWYSEDIKKYCAIENAEEFCASHGIQFRRVPFTNSTDTQKLFKEANVDIGLSLGNGYISSKIFNIPKYGMLNIHHEILPDYQNAQSIIWQLYNGSTETGYTIHQIDKHIDTGNILLQQKLNIVFRNTLADTVAYNYAKLYDASAVGLVTLLENFDQYFFAASPQTKGNTYTTPSFWQFRKITKQFIKLKSKYQQLDTN